MSGLNVECPRCGQLYKWSGHGWGVCPYCAGRDAIEFHTARMRAFFEEAEFQNVDKLMSGTIADFAELGRQTAKRTREAIREAREGAILAHWKAIKHLFSDIKGEDAGTPS